MNWFKRKIYNWVNRSELNISKMPEPASRSSLDVRGLRISLYPAHGGTVVEIYQIGEVVKSHHSNSPELYIIKENDDLGTELTKILTMEMLRRS